MVSPSSPHMTLEEFEKTALELFKEYFEHGDTQEVVESLEEFNIKNFKPEVCTNGQAVWSGADVLHTSAPLHSALCQLLILQLV